MIAFKYKQLYNVDDTGIAIKYYTERGYYTPVSYTHLDVYKRQMLKGAEKHPGLIERNTGSSARTSGISLNSSIGFALTDRIKSKTSSIYV